MSKVTVVLLRHGKVASHKGDMPLTADALADVEAAVPRLQALATPASRFVFLATETNRSRQTAEALRAAVAPDASDVRPAWGLRNPDVYLAGSRVELGSSAEFFAGQCAYLDMTPELVTAQSFFSGFLTAADRIEYWLFHQTPPGEDAAAVAKRVFQFAHSFLAADTGGDLIVACVTHSPVMRAVLHKGLNLADTGEPNWVEEIVLNVSDDMMTYRYRDKHGQVAILT